MDSESYGEGGYRRGPYWGRGPKGYQPSDVRIRENVCEAIAEHGWVDASDVEVLVEDCEVVLRGTVASRADKRSLEDLAEGVAGVRDVRNELRISSPPRRA